MTLKPKSGTNTMIRELSVSPFFIIHIYLSRIANDIPTTEAKGQFILSQGLKGFAMWDAGSDYDDLLLDAICTGMGSS